ncbi:hypothetical protein Tco_1362615 [Tanacetum coccineum]
MEDMINQSKKRKTETLNDTVFTQPNKTHVQNPPTTHKRTNSYPTYKPSSPRLGILNPALDQSQTPTHLTRQCFQYWHWFWDTTTITATLKICFSKQYGEVEEGLDIVKIDGKDQCCQLASAKDIRREMLDGRKVYCRICSLGSGSEEDVGGILPCRVWEIEGRGRGICGQMAVEGKEGESGWRDDVAAWSSAGWRTSIVVITGGPTLLPHQNPPAPPPPPSETGIGPGYGTQGPPSHSILVSCCPCATQQCGYARAWLSSVPVYLAE